MVYSEYNKTILPNGLTVVSEKIPSVRSVSVGVWVKSGTRHESRETNGIAHFLEHMMFKGTERRSALQIARSLESVGGYLNAFTSKEQTCFYAEILDDQLPRAVDVLSDMVCHSVFSPREMEKEREVILDEIDSVEDTPEDLVQEIFVEKMFPKNGLGLPILGSKKTVSAITREQLLQFYRKNYTTQNIIISGAGNLDHSRLVELVEKYFSVPPHPPENHTAAPRKTGNGDYVIHRAVNQAHICLGTPGLPYEDPHKYELLLLNTLLGVGMGSRLFQNIREKHGVAYAVYSYADFFRDSGLFAIYLGTEKAKVDKALKLIDRELEQLKEKPISRRELNQVKSQVKGNLVLGLESTARRMSRLAKMEIYLERFLDIDEVIDEIDRVTREGLHELVNRLFDRERLLRVMFLPK